MITFETVQTGPMQGELVRLEVFPPAILVKRMRWQEQGLSYTATGYGSKIPTQYMIKTIDERWRRVYCAIYSNVGTCYVMHGKEKTIVELNGI